MKIVTIVGARPQFIKAAAVSNAIGSCNQLYGHLEEVLVHTGQHFDANMSDVFFDEMKIPKPHYNLLINNLSHGAMTGRMVEAIEEVLVQENPDWVLLYGDTNSTIAGAIAAAKLHVKIAHVEAGLRSFNMKMPEEVNRIVTDRLSTFLFCPSEAAITNLKNEGLECWESQAFNVGDVMYDTTLHFSRMAKPPDVNLPENFVLATIHRAENTDDPQRLKGIFDAFNTISAEVPVVLPLHPRTRAFLIKQKIALSKNVLCIDPVSYLEMLYLLSNCELVFTDSGGLQKEAFFSKKFCITLRDETEWVELVSNNVNRLVGADPNNILQVYEESKQEQPDFDKELYGDGRAAEKIVQLLLTNNNV